MRKKLQIAMRVLVVLLWSGLFTREVLGADWVLYAVSLDGTVEEYYDRESATPPEAGVVNVTTKAVKYDCEEGRDKKKRARGDEMARDNLTICAYSITRHRIDCRSRVDTLLSSADYDHEGRMIQQSRDPYVLVRPPLRRSPQEIYPDSFSENLIKMFCPPVH